MLVITAVTVNAISVLFRGRNNELVGRNQVRPRAGSCIGPAIDVLPVPPGPNPPGLIGDETEHPLEVRESLSEMFWTRDLTVSSKPQFAARFLETITLGTLRGPAPNGRAPFPSLPRVDGTTIYNFWNHPLHSLGNRPPIGGPKGDSPNTAEGRLMGAFGSTGWPEPLIPTDKQINGPKGKLWKLNDPIGIETRGGISNLARDAFRLDTLPAAELLLQAVRTVSSDSHKLVDICYHQLHVTDSVPRQGFVIMEYMNHPEFIHRFNLARDQVRTQLGYIEEDFRNAGHPVDHIQEWWDVVLDDYMDQLQTTIQNFQDRAITAAFAPFNNNQARNLQNYNHITNTLFAWLNMARLGQGLRFDARYFVRRQPPP